MNLYKHASNTLSFFTACVYFALSSPAIATTTTSCKNSGSGLDVVNESCLLSALIDTSDPANPNPFIEINGVVFNNFQEAFISLTDHENILVRAIDVPGRELGLTFIPIPSDNPLSFTSTGPLVNETIVFEYDVVPFQGFSAIAELNANFLTIGAPFDFIAQAGISTDLDGLGSLNVLCPSPDCSTFFARDRVDIGTPGTTFKVTNTVFFEFDADTRGTAERTQKLGQFTNAFSILGSPTNFFNEITGNLTEIGTGVLQGTYSAKLKYNLRDETTAPSQTPPRDGFPDKMMFDDDNNPVGSNGLVIWANDPSNLLAVDPTADAVSAYYTPFSAFQNEYIAEIHLDVTSGPNAGVYNFTTDINRIIVTNNLEIGFTRCHDIVLFETSIANFVFDQESGCDGGTGPQPDKLMDVFLYNALINLNKFERNPGLFTRAAMDLDPTSVGFDFGGVITSIGQLTADIPPVPLNITSNDTWRTNVPVQVPGDEWKTTGFDDSVWPIARVPYPSPTVPTNLISGTTAEHMWHDPANSSDGTSGSIQALFRHSFYLDLPSNVKSTIGTAKVSVDDDYEFYVNGTLVFENKDGGNADVVDTIDFSSALQDGENVFAIHAVDGGWDNPRDRIYERVLLDALIVNADLTGDGCVDRSDLDTLIDAIRGGSQDRSFDLNGDGRINIADARKLVTRFTNSRGVPCN